VTHGPRIRTPLGGDPVDARPLHDVVNDWRERQRPVVEPCVCGGPDLRAVSNEPGDVTEAVVRHQVEPLHIAYDRAHGIPLTDAQKRASAMDGDLTREPIVPLVGPAGWGSA
jgi:hypothetical protein